MQTQVWSEETVQEYARAYRRWGVECKARQTTKDGLCAIIEQTDNAPLRQWALDALRQINAIPEANMPVEPEWEDGMPHFLDNPFQDAADAIRHELGL